MSDNSGCPAWGGLSGCGPAFPRVQQTESRQRGRLPGHGVRLVLLLVMAVGALAAQSTPADLPKAETILDRYVEATGGKAAYEQRHSEVATGTIEMVGAGVTGTIADYRSAPDKAYTELEVNGVGKIQAGSNGEVAWELSALQGPRVKSGDEKADAMRDSIFNGPIRWREIYPKVVTAGSATVDGEDCYKVVATPKDSKPETQYYSKKSGLLLKTEGIQITSMGEIPVEETMSNYKDAGGILAPYTITQKGAGQEMKVEIQNVKVNTEIPASRFDLPAEIKELVAKSKSPAQSK
ncbi:MAG TPA: DUF620 domain-containing protein [Bryobacteraceae bacterium]|nr:DUF620 domain-containing protein [Bryobacteraceae bacterium]